MRPVLIPVGTRVARLALRGRGVESRWVPAQSARLHAYDARGSGDLATTVLLHGLGSTATAFGGLLRRLRREVRRVVAPDFPGHGLSPAGSGRTTPDALIASVSSALGALVDEPAVLVGHSLGGAVALHYALAHPERVRALVLVSPAGAWATEEEWRALRQRLAIASRAEALAFVQRVYDRPPWFLPLLAFELPAVFGRPAVRDLLASASNDHALSPDAIATLRMPILLVWGRAERLLPETHLEFFARHLPAHAVIERPDGFGHCPHVDVPGALAARITAFARTLPA
jgi:pimeloyl-ACP methyl ester carboxylesterase